MTITPYGSSAQAAWRAETTFGSLKSTLGSLQAQLSTGKVAQTHAGLGTAAATSLSGRARIGMLDGYGANIADAQLRVRLMSQGIGQIGKLAQGLAQSVAGSVRQTGLGQTSAQASAGDGLAQAIDILNSQVGDRYLFSGRTTDTEPVVDFGLMIEGDGTRAGLKQLVAERKAADLGGAGRGRLTLASSGTTTTLSEEAAVLPFGMKIASATATSGITASMAAGPPAGATIDIAAQPPNGATVSVGLTLPDGSRTTITLTATDGSNPGQGGPTFAIGADAAATAANLAGALDAAVRTTATTVLASASTLAASAGFFAGSAANPPVRVAGPPFDTATATVAGTDANTVVWYQGDDGAGSARETAPVRIGDGASLGIGARANEPDLQQILTVLGALAADGFPASDATSQARYAALADRIGDRLGDTPAITSLSTDLSLASVALDNAGDRIAAAKNQMQDVIDGVENTDPNEVAAKLLATQTRLQASYQTTSAISKLSLVNYL